MAVSISSISGSDNVGLSRLAINQNFSALKAASDAVTNLLNPDSLTLTGLKSISVDNAAVDQSVSILSVSKGASILGNLTVGSVGASTSVSIRGVGGVSLTEGSLTIAAGNLNISSSSAVVTINGALSLLGELRLPGVSTSFVNKIGLTSSSTTSVAVSGLKYIVLTNGATSTSALPGLTASLQNGSNGQEIEIFHVAGPSGPVNIDISNFTGLTGNIVLSATGDKLKCIYDGANWYLWDFTQGVPGATQSISFTRI